MLEKYGVFQQQRDASCLVAFPTLEKGKNASVGGDNRMQCLLSNWIAEVLNLFEVGHESIALGRRIDCIEQCIQLTLRRGLPASLN